MPTLSIRGHARVVAALVFAAAIFGDAVQSALPCGTSSTIQRLQFSERGSDIQAVAPQGSPIRDAAIKAHRLDNRVLVPTYFLLFAVAGWLFTRSGSRTDRLAGAGVMLAAAIAAPLDIIENRIILNALADTSATTGPFWWATAKWAAVFAAAVAMATPFLRRIVIKHESRVLSALTGTAFAIGGVLGLRVLLGHAWDAFALALVAVGMLLMALLFIWSPGYFVERE